MREVKRGCKGALSGTCDWQSSIAKLDQKLLEIENEHYASKLGR